MAITPLTGFKAFTFDGEKSTDYGVQILGEGVFNAPEREVEMINIPGRNGAFALDKGRFENIEVTYPANIIADSTADFAAAVSDLRNMLCSRRGYVRLQDDYHPDEYRMAVYKEGLEVDEKVLRAGEFDITFDCKPQRFLTSGEEAITIGEWHETETASGEIASFEAKAGDAVKSLVVDIEPMQSGSGTPSPTNVRPISGYDSVVVSRYGKNLLPNNAQSKTQSGITFTVNSDGTVKVSGTATSAVTLTQSNLFLKAGSYFLSGCPSGGGSSTYEILLDTGSGTIYRDYGSGKAFALANDTTFANWQIVVRSGVTVNNLVFKPMVEQGSTATAYEPYNGNTYSIDLNGTRYGGTLDVASGVLTVEYAKFTWDGTNGNTWTYSSANDYFTTWVSDMASGSYYTDDEVKCNRFEKRQTNSEGIGIRVGANNINVYFTKIPSTFGITSVADWQTWLSSNNVELTYKLATPQTVQLTAQEVELLVGLNQIWANSGDVSVEYGTAPNVLVNPTLFESSPMLEVEGYGTIAFNGYEIELTDDVIGDVLLLGATNDKTYIYYDGSLVNTNDVVTIHDHRNLRFRTNVTTASYTPTSATLTRTTSNIPGTFSYTATLDGRNFVLDLSYSGSDTFSYGTTSSKQDTFTLNIGYTDGNTSGTLTRTFNVTQRATSRYVHTYSTEDTSGGIQIYGSRCSYGEITAYSTQTILGHPTYVECDIGVCYKEVDGEAVSLNQYIDLGSDLPKLASGANTITADNTVTDLKVIPRWWKI